MESIETIHRSKTGKVSDKWASYLPVYDRLFGGLAERPVNLLEIGVQNGGSLETWSRFFTRGRTFVGCDIDHRCARLRFEDPRIRMVVGDANAPDTRARIAELTPGLDIVIDDGSHRSTDIVESFLAYFPLLAAGGIYVVEDCHTLYWPAWRGGIVQQSSAMRFFKALVDVLNFEHWVDQLSLHAYLGPLLSPHPVPDFIAQGWVDAVEFRNSLVIVHKAARPGHGKLGERCATGRQAEVCDAPKRVAAL